MNYLLDVNVLVAWGWSDHEEHARVARWIGGLKGTRKAKLCTSAIPELGFVRVSLHRAGGALEVTDAVATLASMLRSLGNHHAFISDDRSATAGFPEWCGGASRTTDAHLLLLSKAHGLELATLDKGIPGGFLIPIEHAPELQSERPDPSG